jgi:Ni/Co efflux regulator RcnB
MTLTGGMALAQDRPDDHRNDQRDNHQDQRDSHQDQRDNHQDQRDSHQDQRDNHHYVRHDEWRKGTHMNHEDWNRGERVDYRRYRLQEPPQGYEWREVDGNYVMAAVATGVIASVVVASAAH